MDLQDRVILISSMATAIFLIAFISERSIVFLVSILELLLFIGIICAIGWGVERLMSAANRDPEITIEKLNRHYHQLEVISEWDSQRNLSLTNSDKLEIIHSFKERRWTLGSLYMAFVTNIAIIVLAVVTLVISERDTIIRNLLESSSSNSNSSQITQYQIQNLPSDFGIILALALLFLVTALANIYFLWKTVRDD